MLQRVAERIGLITPSPRVGMHDAYAYGAHASPSATYVRTLGGQFGDVNGNARRQRHHHHKRRHACPLGPGNLLTPLAPIEQLLAAAVCVTYPCARVHVDTVSANKLTNLVVNKTKKADHGRTDE